MPTNRLYRSSPAAQLYQTGVGLRRPFSLLYNEVDDALAAADALEKLPYVDAKRLYVAGPGTGGTLALLTAMTSPRFRAAGSFSSTPDLARWAETWAPLHAFDVAAVEVPGNQLPPIEPAMKQCIKFFQQHSEPLK